MTDPPAEDAPSVDQLRAIADAHRRVLVGLVAVIVVNIALNASAGVGTTVLLVVLLGVTVLLMHAVFRLCQAMGRRPTLLVLLTLIPVVNLITLVFLDRQASALLKLGGATPVRFGYRV